MGKVKDINIKIITYHFYDDMVNIKDFDSNLLKIKEALENYTELWNEMKDQTELISDVRPTEYKKDFMKIKFEADDDLPSGKMLSIPLCVIIVKSVF